MPIMSPGPVTFAPGFPGGTYPNHPTYQGNPYPPRPVVRDVPNWSPRYNQGNAGVVPPAPQYAQQTPQPKIRFQAPDETPPQRRLSLPSPEDLGVRPVSSTALPATQVDWNAVRARMQQLGVLSFRVDHMPAGSHRVTFLLPTSDPGRTNLLETTADTEAGAVQLALERAAQSVK